MIRQPGHQMMKRVIAKPDRRPQRGDHPRRGDVDAVEKLAGDTHRLALILPQMRDQRPHLVEQHRPRRDGQEDQERAKRHHPGRNHHDQRDRPQARRALLPAPLAGKLALGALAAERRVDLKTRIAPDDDLAKLRRHQRQRGQHGEADHQRDRGQHRRDHEHRQRPRPHQRQRKILRVLDRAIAGLGVVEVMDPLIEKARDQQRNADDCIPRQLEPAQFARLDVRQLMDETPGAEQSEDRDHPRRQRQRPRVKQHRAGQRGIADQRRAEEIGPVNVRARGVELTSQAGDRLQHRPVVAGRRGGGARCRFRRGGIAGEGSRDRHNSLFGRLNEQR